MKKYIKAFITVEYTLLISLVFVIYGLLLGIGIFLYNQSIMQSNVRILATEGMTTLLDDSRQKVEYLQEKESGLYEEKYLFMIRRSTTYNVTGESIQIESRGFMDNPISAWGVGEAQWSLEVSCKADTVSPKNTLRLCKRLLKWKEDVLKGEEVDDK